MRSVSYSQLKTFRNTTMTHANKTSLLSRSLTTTGIHWVYLVRFRNDTVP